MQAHQHRWGIVNDHDGLGHGTFCVARRISLRGLGVQANGLARLVIGCGPQEWHQPARQKRVLRWHDVRRTTGREHLHQRRVQMRAMAQIELWWLRSGQVFQQGKRVLSATCPIEMKPVAGGRRGITEAPSD